ncbi:MAG: hypothetical protein WCE44_13590 [Candidatus Velthaea sp.]|jgi:hypothetical protein
MSKQPTGHLLKIGDHVLIPGEDLAGVVSDVARHEITVHVLVDGQTQHRKYAREALDLEPTMGEASRFIDH